ncbi:XTP/dITP diphosphatase [Nitratidesulfovibrio termitidis]|uniref:XTP/dITP diphosphatase n=1 Tax=Nitratidesulfovibrio termitidis TaxID=42252 RepID=UPI00040CF3B5|nr:XTP/dITP diphosphatase [Nitratidesulfovibrio termitidis]
MTTAPNITPPNITSDTAVIVLATRNAGKIRELNDMLKDTGVTVVGLDAYPEIGEIEETGTTFEENALLKARTVAELTGRIAVADDSGLEVDALGGAPGVYSARYSAEDGVPATDARNNEKLLAALADVPDAQRTARFRSVIAACAPDGRHITAAGAWEGRVATAPQGDNGFGYDPLFFDPELGRTAATLARDEKNARSHRGKALRRLLEMWPAFAAQVR